MRILAIETIDFSGTIAAMDSDSVLSERTLDDSLRSAQALAPSINDLLQHIGWQPADVQLVAVVTGPGSFTGLRVGVTTAKMFAYAVGAEVLGIHTLTAIAAQTQPLNTRLWTVLNAERGQVFAAVFEPGEKPAWVNDPQTMLLHEAEWFERLQPGDSVSGPVLQKLKASLPLHVRAVDASDWRPRAVTVGQIAWQNYQSGSRQQLATLLPRYYRRSAAEEKRLLQPNL